MKIGADNRLAICVDGALTIKAASAFSGISRSVLYEKISKGELTPIKIGRRVLLPKAQLVGLLADGIHGDPG